MDLINQLYSSSFITTANENIVDDINEMDKAFVEEALEFKDGLDEGSKNRFEELMQKQREIHSLKLADSYADGFKAGAKIMFDIMKKR